MNIIFSKNKMFFILFFEIILNIKIIQNNSVVIPFEEHIINNNELDKETSYSKILLDNYLDYKIFTEIKIGTPSKRIPVLINPNIKIFRMKIEEKISSFDFNKYDKYIPHESSSFLNITKILNLEEFYFFGYSLINETIKLCENKNCENEVEIKNIQFYAETKRNYLNDNYSYSFGELGISYSKKENEQSNLLIELKNLGIINSSIITFEYNENKGGNIYIGDYPHIYNSDQYDKNLLMSAYTIPNFGINNQIKIKMDKVYIKDTYTNSNIYFNNSTVLLNYGSGIILSTEEYFNKILEIYFNKYISLNICKINIEKRGINNNYQVISCRKNDEFKINEFPSLFLFKEELDFIFELTYQDLFEIIGESYYFLIIYFPFSNNEFELGKPFLKKYQLSYDVDMSTIHFYKKITQKAEKIIVNKENKNIFYLFILIIIFGFLILVFYKKCFHKKRKLRKNELKEDYNYNFDEDDINRMII